MQRGTYLNETGKHRRGRRAPPLNRFSESITVITEEEAAGRPGQAHCHNIFLAIKTEFCALRQLLSTKLAFHNNTLLQKTVTPHPHRRYAKIRTIRNYDNRRIRIHRNIPNNLTCASESPPLPAAAKQLRFRGNNQK